MSEPRPLFYLDSDELNGKVTAGDLAHRTAKLLLKELTPVQFDNLIYFLGEMRKEAQDLQDTARVLSARAAQLADLKKREAIKAEMTRLGIPTNMEPPKAAAPPKPKEAPMSIDQLADIFGVK